MAQAHGETFISLPVARGKPHGAGRAFRRHKALHSERSIEGKAEVKTINELLANLSPQQVQWIIGRPVATVFSLGDRSYSMDAVIERNGKAELIRLEAKFYTVGNEIDFTEKWSERV